jgi:hypothetical protein
MKFTWVVAILALVGGVSITSLSTGFSIAGGTTSKTLTVDNTITLAGTDGSTLNIGGGGSPCIPGSFGALTDGATVTWAIGSAVCANASLLFTAHSGSRILNLTGLVNGGSYTLIIQQDSTGGEGLTLGSGCGTWYVARPGGGWTGGGTVTPSTGANAYNTLSLFSTGSACFLNFQ